MTSWPGSAYSPSEEPPRLLTADSGAELVRRLPPELIVVHGQTEIGTIYRSFVEAHGPGSLSFVLGGRSWAIEHISLRHARCHVIPAASGRYPAWPGQPRFLSRELCRAVREVLLDDSHDHLHRRRHTLLPSETRGPAVPGVGCQVAGAGFRSRDSGYKRRASSERPGR